MTDRLDEISAAAFSEANEPEPAPNLIAKLAAIMGAITQRVPKRGRNEFHKYDYSTEADILDMVRGELIAKRVLIIPECLSVSRDGEITTSEELMHVIDADTGESRVYRWFGSGQDKGDKGLYKAYTGADKYFLLKLFKLPTGDDPERDENAPTTKKDLVESPPPPSDGQTYVAKVESKTGQGKKGAWTRYTVTLSDGQYGSTFDQKLATACEQFRDRQTPVVAEFEQDGKFTNIVSCQSAAATYVVERVAGKAGPDGIERPPFRLFVKGDDKIYLTEDASIADEANDLAGKGAFTWRTVEKTIDTADGERTIYYVDDVRIVPF